jgi:beta-aspartyl-peptidase (threonine type)
MEGHARRTSLFVHGGVSGTARGETGELALAIRAGLESRSAIDVVEAAVVVLENDPELNAGFGATLSSEGTIELDAGIADGRTGLVGGVANVAVENPIRLARAVMEQTPHVLVTGAGAAALGARLGMDVLGSTSQRQQERFRKAEREGRFGREHFGSPEAVDTVGAVALDEDGYLAAGSSTGGVFGKLPGRVGDSPVFGAGFYADGVAAVVGTGVGEEFLRTVACYRVAHRISAGASPQEACEEMISELGRRSDKDTAGLLALNRDGRVGAAFRGAMWQVEGPAGPFEARQMD